MSQFYGFKMHANGIMRDLKTECGALPGFDPNTSGTRSLPIKFLGLWDTGATGTVISPKVVATLGLKPVGKTQVFHANGHSIVNEYFINLYLPNKVAIPLVRVTVCSYI